MSNPMRYIKDLEAAGFQRNQAEAQVQMVLDALEGDLVTKSDFNLFQEKLENRFVQTEHRFEQRFTQVDQRFEQLVAQMDKRFAQVDQRFELVQRQIKETELRVTIRLGIMMVSGLSITVALLTWLIKI